MKWILKYPKATMNDGLLLHVNSNKAKWGPDSSCPGAALATQGLVGGIMGHPWAKPGEYFKIWGNMWQMILKSSDKLHMSRTNISTSSEPNPTLTSPMPNNRSIAKVLKETLDTHKIDLEKYYSGEWHPKQQAKVESLENVEQCQLVRSR